MFFIYYYWSNTIKKEQVDKNAIQILEKSDAIKVLRYIKTLQILYIKTLQKYFAVLCKHILAEVLSLTSFF